MLRLPHGSAPARAVHLALLLSLGLGLGLGRGVWRVACGASCCWCWPRHGMVHSLQTRQTAAVSTRRCLCPCFFLFLRLRLRLPLLLRLPIFTLSAANFQQLFITPSGAGIANGGASPLKINKDYDKMNVLIYVKLPVRVPPQTPPDTRD